ncbi:hypothetical protein [Gottfriedia acidiceleris]|uniref:hypothetical protein n=1 Tax=Gottfriedia acidiceleris TaxID=371036 RepID=UPI000B445FD4|nr:hypothetical protein [Gottfriedia acidiceleris]
MKKKIIFVFIFLIAFCLIVKSYSFFEDGPFYTKFVKSTDLSNETFDRVGLHDNINRLSFTKRFGEPLEKADNDFYDYYLWNNGLETASIIIGKNKGEIVRLIIGDINNMSRHSELETIKRIKLGNSKEEIISLYGPNYFKRVEQGCNIIGYVDKKNKIIIEFWLADKVVEIRLEDINTN